MALDFAATYKVLVLGDSNVGKTCIVHRFCDERYYDTYISTIGKNCSAGDHDIGVGEGQEICLSVLSILTILN